jgi:F-type H+-transporting ATPase subunit gamma
MGAGQLREVRDRIKSVKNTEKITDAMRLVAAAKVRRAQDAVLRTRPFSETLQKVLGGLIGRLQMDFSDLPLLQTREPKKVVVVVITGDRGLCGSYNSYAIKRAEERIKTLEGTGAKVTMVCIGKKGGTYFSRRERDITRKFLCVQNPTAEDASAISDVLLAEYLSGEVDRVELVYTRFVSLIASNASVRTLLPLSPTGLEAEGDEVFQLTSAGGKFSVKKAEIASSEPSQFPADMIFEQEPLQILNAILPLYLNGQILRMLQESVASELAARMQSMQSATDNAKNLRSDLSLYYNRGRQAAITQEIAEVCGGTL